MVAYLVCEDGPHAGQVIALSEGDEWIIGRDPDVSFQVLEDPMVSRRHALFRLDDGLYFLENLSTVNPTHINDTPLQEVHQLHEDDIIQIGNNYFRFTETLPADKPKDESEEIVSEEELSPAENSLSSLAELSKLPFGDDITERWMIKVISGPNQGAEFGMDLGHSYVIGKDPGSCDIIFQDLSVSREHSKVSIDKDGNATIEDLESRNGIMLNGEIIDGASAIASQDLITLGTTSFLFIDRERSQETIYSPPSYHYRDELDETSEDLIDAENYEEGKALDTKRNWKQTFIPTRHIIVASIFSLVIFVGFVSLLALFRSQSVAIYHYDASSEIEEVLHNFKDVQFTYNEGSGKLFLVGHVLTDVDHSELMYLVKSLSFIQRVEDNVVVDEGVWESMNALLSKNPNWRSVMVTATRPGKFALKGYLETEAEAENLQDYVNLNFPYLNLLENQVVVENTLYTQVQSMLIEKGFVNVTFQFNSGELIFAGRVNEKEQEVFEKLLDEVDQIEGIRQVKDFVIFTGASTARVDLSGKYQVTGTSKYGSVSQFVLINGKILGKGEVLDGMTITDITSNEVLLDKDGMKYKIDYNQP